MNFITFPVQATNVFPAANFTNGSQLVTEWNMRAREMVVTDPDVDYQIGPSFVHGLKDFEVSIYTDVTGVLINSYTLKIAEGRAVINGHYVETLVPMTIDLVEANASLQAQARPVLKGSLAIGIRTFYSSEQTVAGSILSSNDNDMLLGLQLVVLPNDELITPIDSPSDPTKVTADIRLATFTFLNNNITDIRNSESKLQYLSPRRIGNLTSIISSKYVTKTGLNPKRIYAFAGKGSDPSTGSDTWEDATDSLMVWDYLPQRTTTRPDINEAQIVTVADRAYLVIPHKQIEGMTTDEGDPEYYAPRIMELPTADYILNTPGLVNIDYTKQVKAIATQVSDFKSFVHGKQIQFWDVRERDQELPPVNQNWETGDYILVKNDKHFTDSDDQPAPATMYAVLPGQVIDIHFVTQVNGDATHSAAIPSNIHGSELSHQDWYQSEGKEPPETEYPDHYPEFFGPSDIVRGLPGNASSNEWEDYFRIRYFRQNSQTYEYTDYFYAVLHSSPKAWSDALVVTGAISLATESTTGGFYNVTSEAVDQGYVRLDDSGHLVLTDYQLLRSGTLAYQIATDLDLPEFETYTELQSAIDEYVNNRIAFPAEASHGAYPSVLNINIPLFASADPISIEISGIDSRFNTAICLHIKGSANNNVTVNIVDCQRIIIDNDIEGTPVINLIRTNLFYDPQVMQYIKTCYRDTTTGFTGFKDITLWHEQLNEDTPVLLVNGMTISEFDAQIMPTNISYWREEGSAINDNNYLLALKSITFSGSGDIVGCEVLVANNSTDNITPGDKIVVGQCALPQGASLNYPEACLTRTLKVSGEFTSAYYSDSNWYVTDNSFSFATGTYSASDPTWIQRGTIAFHSVTTLVPSTLSETSINVWEPDSYHLFRGGSIS